MGASNVRTIRSAFSSAAVTASAAAGPVLSLLAILAPFGFLLFGFQKIRQRIEAVFPELAVLLDPIGGGLQAFRLDAAAPPLGVALAGDETGLLQHFQVPRDRRQGDVEGLGQLADRGFA